MFKRFLALLLALITTSSYGEAPAWLAVGDLRGHIEPCGCDPTADLGGLLRLSTLLKRERALTPSLKFFSLGNNLTPAHASDPIKNDFILQGLSELKPDATLLNVTELASIEWVSKKNILQNFILSNKNKKLTLLNAVKTEHVDPTGTVFGFFYDKKFAKYVDPLSEGLLQQWKKSKSARKILLFSGSDQDLTKICRAGIFQIILRSNPLPLDKIFSNEEKQNPAPLGFFPECPQTVVHTVPVGGQGVVRGGLLAEKRAPSLSEILSKGKRHPPQNEPSDGTSPLFGNVQWLSWLDTSYQVGATLEPLMQNFLAAKSKEFQQMAGNRLADLKNSPFAGPYVCKDCHESAFKVWQNSGHSRALQALENKGQHQNSECVECHALGLKEKGGFVSKEASPNFAFVTCENCHGPRKGHAANPQIKPKLTVESKKVCTSCHHGMHTANFEFERFWAKIKHGF